MQCTVRGVLVLILYMSRALGGAPLGLSRVNEGYIATISLIAAVYGYIFTLCSPITECMHLLIYVEYLKVILLQMESNLIHYDVLCMCEEINMKIRKLIDETQDLENISLATLRSTSKNVQDISKSYVSICDFVKRLNEDRGVLLYALYSSIALSIIFTMCNLTEAFFLPGGIQQTIQICIQLVWTCLHLFSAAFFIEPCHKVEGEISKMQSLWSQLMYNVTSVGKSIPLQLDLMFKQFFINKLSFSPLQMLTFQRSLLATMIGFITTYVVILVQYVEKKWTA
ncbi:unnamed protein product [Euphydryas editha]|uniref:Gustatory receptor n=1 Tax=Euphydryas editha TaxID=104508 RepID=A0AAU9U7Y3_EUPED|nr:unnamed protein product [Euphydryas editha]